MWKKTQSPESEPKIFIFICTLPFIYKKSGSHSKSSVQTRNTSERRKILEILHIPLQHSPKPLIRSVKQSHIFWNMRKNSESIFLCVKLLNFYGRAICHISWIGSGIFTSGEINDDLSREFGWREREAMKTVNCWKLEFFEFERERKGIEIKYQHQFFVRF